MIGLHTVCQQVVRMCGVILAHYIDLNVSNSVRGFLFGCMRKHAEVEGLAAKAMFSQKLSRMFLDGTCGIGQICMT